MSPEPWRTCEDCGRVYPTRADAFNLYSIFATTINPDAVVDEADPLDFCPACGEDFDEQEEE